MKRFKLSIFILSALMSMHLLAQENTYGITLEPIEIPQLGGIQSFAIAQVDGEWLIIGGRLDGLHRRQPFAAFDLQGHNTQAIVINPTTEEVWKASYDNLPANLADQLSSTNMQSYQDGNYLILTGGYGYTPSMDKHRSFPHITLVKVKELIQQVKNQAITSSSFVQKIDEKFAVTGGGLQKIEDTYYLVAGHRFDGLYNPIGPEHGPGFEQEYTHEIRPFKLDISEDGNFEIEHITASHDELHLRRRDYNLVPQIQNGQEEMMVFSGVFQPMANIPWLYPIRIMKDDYEPLENFKQYYNHYHCATLPIYNEEQDEMHTIFFGGIAQFYVDNGIIVQDNDIPFVNTITDLTRVGDYQLDETVLDTSMPGLLGAGSEFIPAFDAPMFNQDVIAGDKIGSESILIGYIYGGIRSQANNIFFINDGSQSAASNTIFKVMIYRKNLTETNSVNVDKHQVLIYPNPAQDIVRIAIDLDEISDIKVSVYDINGASFGSQTIPKAQLKLGTNSLILDDIRVQYGSYIYSIQIGDKTINRKVVWVE